MRSRLSLIKDRFHHTRNISKHVSSTKRDFGLFSNWLRRIIGRSNGDSRDPNAFEFEYTQESRFPSVFEQIMNREIPAEMIHEDDVCIGLLDIAPSPPTQFLIAPKKYIDGIKNMPCTAESKKLLGHMLLVAKDLADQMEMYGGYRIVLNQGEHGCQLYDHLHIYVIGTRQLDWPPG